MIEVADLLSEEMPKFKAALGFVTEVIVSKTVDHMQL